ncbi:hypothetical protein L1887_19557 [Cichorium endivia]|nr:hypothetical protein L1887_19557 [Cichorium endivia]
MGKLADAQTYEVAIRFPDEADEVAVNLMFVVELESSTSITVESLQRYNNMYINNSGKQGTLNLALFVPGISDLGGVKASSHHHRKD